MRGALSRLAAVGLIALTIALPVGASGAADLQAPFPPYDVYRPAGLSRAKPVPLVIGIGGSATRDGSAFNSFADRYGFVVAYPDPTQINVPPNEDASQIARLQYLSGIVDQLKVTQNIDPTRVYVTGASRSGIESYRVACSNVASKVTAIGSVAGALLTKEFAACHPSRPISVMEVHGTADTAVPIGGNQFYTPAATTMAFFRKVDQCPAQANVTVRGRVTIQTWGPCAAGTSVRLIVYSGGDHGWPRNNDIDTTAELWSFFAQHSSTAQATATSRLMSLTVGRGASGRVLRIHIVVAVDSTIHANVTRNGRRFGTGIFHTKAGARTLRVRLTSRARPGTYKLRLVLTASGASQTIVKSFRIRG